MGRWPAELIGNPTLAHHWQKVADPWNRPFVALFGAEVNIRPSHARNHRFNDINNK